MHENKESFFKKGGIKVTLFRMWAAGAVCFFAAWGRMGAEEVGNPYSLDLITGLIAVMAFCDICIVNPVLRLVGGKPVIDKSKKIPLLILDGLLHIIKITILMLLIIGSYYLLNVAGIRLRGLDKTAVPVPLEPLLFGILYGLYYTAFETAGKALSALFSFNFFYRSKHEKSFYSKPY